MSNILSTDDARYVAKCFKDYYLKFESIQDYQYECLKDRDFVPSLFGDNEEIFSDFNMSPEDMNFKIHSIDTMTDGKEKYHQLFSNLLELTGSNNIERSIPGRKLRWLIEETTTGKYVGMIRMGSPTTYSKPRNDLLGEVAELKHLNHRMMMGFNIVPTQPFGYNYLGGKLLSLLCCSHEMKRQFDEKYDTDLAYFETTSLYGSSKASSQYDGLKPYIKYIGLSISDLVPLIQGELYEHLCDYFKQRNNGGANTSSFIYHRGTGNFNIETQDSAAIKLRTAGANALTIDSSQRVGIGTTAPSSILHLYANDPTITLDDSGTAATIKNASGNIYYNTSSVNRDHIFQGAGTEKIRLTGDGLLGIGTSSPSEKLQVEGNIRASGDYKIGANKVIEQVGTRLNIGDVSSNDYIVDITGYGDTSSIVLNDGFIDVVGDFDITGALSKSSGSFKIDHPLKPETHHLVHSFVESPQADNTYSGVINLQNGRAIIDLDDEFNMTPGTFLALNRELRAFVNNADTWDLVRAKVMGSQLIIDCQNPDSNAEVSWLVIGERQDKEIHESSLTDDMGKIIVEPPKVG